MACGFCNTVNEALPDVVYCEKLKSGDCTLSMEKTESENKKEFTFEFETFGCEENHFGWGKFDFNFCPFCGENLENIKE